jgi:hypothetical protein
VGQPDKYKQSPAYKTATINDSKENTLYEIAVRPVRDLVSSHATDFSKSTGLVFSLNDFQSNFLDRPDLEKVVFFFVYNVYNHVQRNRFKQAPLFFENDFSKLRNLDSIFNMCLVIEEILQHKYARIRTNYYISDGVLDLAAANAWIPTGKTREETEKQFFSKLTGVDLRLDPSATVPVILSGKITYDGGPLRPELRYLLLAWHLRNYGGHNVRAQDILVQSYDRIFEWLMFALFVSIVCK